MLCVAVVCGVLSLVVFLFCVLGVLGFIAFSVLI
jgi:hypothetical protein